jgi:hypothetical protein
MSTGSIHYGRHRHGTCPICQEDFGDVETGQLVCGHIICEECLVYMTDSVPRQNLRCPQCRTGINWDQVRGARTTISESEEGRSELDGLTRYTFDPMEASLFVDTTEEDQEMIDRAMDGLTESAR